MPYSRSVTQRSAAGYAVFFHEKTIDENNHLFPFLPLSPLAALKARPHSYDSATIRTMAKWQGIKFTEDKMVCLQCGSTGKPTLKAKGSFGLELLLIIVLPPILIAINLMIAAIVFIFGIAYSVWRSGRRIKTCPICGSDQMIPVNTPLGRKLSSDSPDL